jgi:hypothetical protein
MVLNMQLTRLQLMSADWEEGSFEHQKVSEHSSLKAAMSLLSF